MTAALSELLTALETASGCGLDCIGGLFGVRRSATLDLDFAATDGVICTWRDVEPDVFYRDRIVAVVKETAERATAAVHYDTTQRPVRTARVAIVDQAPDPRCTIRRESPLRPDGFSQAAVDAAKAVLLAPAKKRGAR